MQQQLIHSNGASDQMYDIEKVKSFRSCDARSSAGCSLAKLLQNVFEVICSATNFLKVDDQVIEQLNNICNILRYYPEYFANQILADVLDGPKQAERNVVLKNPKKLFTNF